eukprot:TRINITY_DN482_c1_g1_i7.p1 TRINITY_DN482_c1_g1~~TRINITY_DN482_c1_g1_i7.p1  ORF type:complete len:320 (+),score=107.08 TRINITY_DN482_c1_g1_i7:110-961(+)
MSAAVRARRRLLRKAGVLTGDVWRDGAVVSALINAAGCVVGLAAGSFRHLDAVGAVANLATVLTAVENAGAAGRAGPLAVLATVAGAWAIRLGTFLAYRAAHLGDDSRLAKMKSPAACIMVWLMQFVWGYVTVLPVLAGAAAAAKGDAPSPAGAAVSYAGSAFAAFGLCVESLADYQKMAFKSLHPEKFMSSGLFAYSRHPNYLGEMMVWAGLASAAQPLTAARPALAALAAASPLYVFAFIRYVSGVPMLVRAAEKRYGKDPAYQAYKASTGLLLPRVTKSL